MLCTGSSLSAFNQVSVIAHMLTFLYWMYSCSYGILFLIDLIFACDRVNLN